GPGRARPSAAASQREGNTSADLGEAQSLAGMLSAPMPPEQLNDLRRRLKARIRLLVRELWVLVVPAGGKRRLCAVQMHFHGGRSRSYLVFHQPGRSYGKGRIEGRWRAWSLAEVAKPGDLDLRKQKQAKQLESLLARIDVRALVGVE